MSAGAKGPAAPAAGFLVAASNSQAAEVLANEPTSAQMLRANTPGVAPKLTAKQRAEVKSLIEDSGWTRAEAVAWVTEMSAVES